MQQVTIQHGSTVTQTIPSESIEQVKHNIARDELSQIPNTEDFQRLHIPTATPTVKIEGDSTVQEESTSQEVSKPSTRKRKKKDDTALGTATTVKKKKPATKKKPLVIDEELRLKRRTVVRPRRFPAPAPMVRDSFEPASTMGPYQTIQAPTDFDVRPTLLEEDVSHVPVPSSMDEYRSWLVSPHMVHQVSQLDEPLSDPDHRFSNRGSNSLTENERSTLIRTRLEQLENGQPSLLPFEVERELVNPIRIAEEELRRGLIQGVISTDKRLPMPVQSWNISDLLLPDTLFSNCHS